MVKTTEERLDELENRVAKLESQMLKVSEIIAESAKLQSALTKHVTELAEATQQGFEAMT